MENAAGLLFYFFAGLAIVFSLMVILKKNPIDSAFSLVLVFFCFAAIYAMLSAHLIAAMQILVYAGAIMVLFVFVIMLLNADEPNFDLGKSHKGLRFLVSIGAFVLFATLVFVFKNQPAITEQSKPALGKFTQTYIESVGGNTKVVSDLMFSEYLLPFELTSVLLLAAIVGAVAIAKRKLGAESK